MLAVIMAGGKGTRLRPLTCDKPKPMVPVANRPLLEHVVHRLVRAGWDQIALTLHYQPEKVEAYFGDGHRFGAKFRYFVEDQPLGTAGSVKAAAGLFDSTFLVASGDALSDFDLRAALAFHRERQAAVTIVLSRVESPLEYGVVMADPDGRITRFIEKPGWGEVFSDTVNTGFYLIEPEVLSLVPRGEAFDFSRDLFPRLLERGKRLYGFVAEGYWSDIGTLEQYRRTHIDILAGRVQLDLPGQAIRPGVWAGQGTEIDPDAKVEGPALLGEHCSIERGAEIGAYSVIGDYNLLAYGSSVRRAILWRHVYVGRGAEVKGAIVGDHAMIKNGASVYEGAVIGDGCRLGSHGVVRPGAKLWPGKNIESGCTIRGSMIWGERAIRGLFGAAGISGVANVEITPEITVRLGAAFTAALGKGRQVAVASDGFPASRVLKRAATAGLLGAGFDVRDLGTVSPPVVRYAVGALGLAGGMHLGLSSRDPWQAVVQFLDARGLPLARQSERALEQAFFSEDFPRVDAAHVGSLSYAPGLGSMYLDAIRDMVDVGAIKAARFTVVVGPLVGPAISLLPGLLERLGCLYAPAEEPGKVDPRVPPGDEALQRAERSMAARLSEVKGVLAVAMDSAAEGLLLVDSNGVTVGPAQLSTLLSLAELHRREGVRIPAAVTASEAIAELARTFKGQVVRTKAHRRMLLEEFAAESPGVQGLVLPAYDALVALAKLLELLAVDRRDLASILACLPKYQRVEKAVACTWAAKGRLMRHLAEEARGKQVDLTDGLRIHEGRGWALILPDGEEPFIRVYSEADTAEEADALGRLYADRIAALQQGE